MTWPVSQPDQVTKINRPNFAKFDLCLKQKITKAECIKRNTNTSSNVKIWDKCTKVFLFGSHDLRENLQPIIHTTLKNGLCRGGRRERTMLLTHKKARSLQRDFAGILNSSALKRTAFKIVHPDCSSCGGVQCCSSVFNVNESQLRPPCCQRHYSKEGEDCGNTTQLTLIHPNRIC